MAELIGQYNPGPDDLERQILEAMDATGMSREEAINFFGFGKERDLPPAPAPTPAPSPAPALTPTRRPRIQVPIPRPFGGGGLIGRHRERTERAVQGSPRQGTHTPAEDELEQSLTEGKALGAAKKAGKVGKKGAR